MWIRMNRATTTFAAAVAAVLLGGAAPARAQEQLTANVPFPFVVGTTPMPAGAYVISDRDESGLLAIAGRDGRAFAFVLTVAETPSRPEPQPRLVFRRVGDEYRLARIVMGGDLIRAIPAPAEGSERSASYGLSVAAYRALN